MLLKRLDIGKLNYIQLNLNNKYRIINLDIILIEFFGSNLTIPIETPNQVHFMVLLKMTKLMLILGKVR